MIIHDIKDNPVLQVSCQEPSTSSKYHHKGPPSWHTSNEDIDMKLSGYLPLGQTWSSMTSRMTLSSTSPGSSSKYPHEGPPILDTLLMKILTWNFQGIFLWVKHGHPWHQGWPCSPSLLSGTLNVLQVPTWRTPNLDRLPIKISKDMILGVYPVHPWHRG